VSCLAARTRGALEGKGNQNLRHTMRSLTERKSGLFCGKEDTMRRARRIHSAHIR